MGGPMSGTTERCKSFKDIERTKGTLGEWVDDLIDDNGITVRAANVLCLRFDRDQPFVDWAKKITYRQLARLTNVGPRTMGEFCALLAEAGYPLVTKAADEFVSMRLERAMPCRRGCAHGLVFSPRRDGLMFCRCVRAR